MKIHFFGIFSTLNLNISKMEIVIKIPSGVIVEQGYKNIIYKFLANRSKNGGEVLKTMNKKFILRKRQITVKID